jgi:hypothetical protein
MLPYALPVMPPDDWRWTIEHGLGWAASYGLVWTSAWFSLEDVS